MCDWAAWHSAFVARRKQIINTYKPTFIYFQKIFFLLEERKSKMLSTIGHVSKKKLGQYYCQILRQVKNIDFRAFYCKLFNIFFVLYVFEMIVWYKVQGPIYELRSRF